MKPYSNKVVIIEPAEIISAGLKSVLEDEGSYNVIKIYNSFSHFKNVWREENEVDIIILNPKSLRYDELENIKNLVPYRDTIIVAIISGVYNENSLRFFDLKMSIDAPSESLIKELDNLTKNRTDSAKTDEHNELSVREKEILVEVAKGLTNKEIADTLNISVHTVITHRKNISKKTGINSISGLTVYAIINKLVDISKL